MDLKRCNHCRLEKPLSDFYRNRHKADGRHHWCAECVNVDVARLKGGAARKYKAHTRPTSQGGSHRRGVLKPGSVASRILTVLEESDRTVAQLEARLAITDIHARRKLANLKALGLVQHDGLIPRRWSRAA